MTQAAAQNAVNNAIYDLYHMSADCTVEEQDAARDKIDAAHEVLGNLIMQGK